MVGQTMSDQFLVELTDLVKQFPVRGGVLQRQIATVDAVAGVSMSIAKGETLVSIADRYFYSERTLRRRLQSVCIKLGVQDRAGAIRAAERLGLF